MTTSFTWRHILYRLFDAEGRLLYVGITNSLNRRLAQHSMAQPWWSEVADCQVAFYPNRGQLAEAERQAIATERPIHNVLGQVSRKIHVPAYVLHPSQRNSARALPLRVADSDYAGIAARAAEEADGNVSEMVRRLLKWSLAEQHGIDVEMTPGC